MRPVIPHGVLFPSQNGQELPNEGDARAIAGAGTVRMRAKLGAHHGTHGTLIENRGGCRWVGRHWPVGSRVLVELCESSPGANDGTMAGFAEVS